MLMHLITDTLVWLAYARNMSNIVALNFALVIIGATEICEVNHLFILSIRA